MKYLGYRFLPLVVIISCAAGACTTQGVPTATPTELAPVVTLTTSGSGSVTAVLAAVADEFEAANSGYELEVLPGSDTGGGVTGTIDGTLDFAAMSRAARENETEKGVQYVQFGTSVTAVITHSNSSVNELTGEQLKDILTGAVTNWSEVGGDDLAIIVYVRDPEEGNTVDIRETFIGEDPFAASAQVMPSQTDMQNVVSTVEGSIGYGTWATALANEANVKNVTVDGIGIDNAPDSMVTTMGIGYLESHAGDVQPLVDWLLSENGQNALKAIGMSPAPAES